MTELVELIITLTDSRSRLDYRPSPKDDPRQRQPDISRRVSFCTGMPVVSAVDDLSTPMAYFDHLPANSREADKLAWKFQSVRHPPRYDRGHVNRRTDGTASCNLNFTSCLLLVEM